MTNCSFVESCMANTDNLFSHSLLEPLSKTTKKYVNS